MDTAVASLAPVEAEAWYAPPNGRACASAADRGTASVVGEAERLSADWTALAYTASEPNVFAESWFAQPALRHLAGTDAPRLVEVRQRETLIGLLPVRVATRYGRIPVRHVQNWLPAHAFLGTPLVRAGHEQAFWSALLAMLDADPWAAGFLHLKGLVEDGPVHRGLVTAAAALGRPCATVLRGERALLASTLSPEAYYEQTVRKKKRKELKRLQARLAELGEVAIRRLEATDAADRWCDDFLALERSGWKGRFGSALDCSPATEAFFREVVAAAHGEARLDFLRLDLDGKPLAMLVNFLASPGSFSFKIAFDETHSRFSPGVLLEIENLAILERPDIKWMDSCASEDHPMINSLWGERRPIVRVTVPLSGIRRFATFKACRAAETLSASLRRFIGRPTSHQQDQDKDD